MKTLITLILIICGIIIGITDASAQRRRKFEVVQELSDPLSPTPPLFTGNVVYLEGASAWFSGALFLNFEHVFHKNWGVRIGGGGGYSIDIANGYGGLLAMNYFSGQDHKFEVGAGLTYSGVVEYQLDGEESKREWAPYPVLYGGYRYQPAGEGIFFRAGVSFFSYGGGAHLAVGTRL
jgi:hypothetical protein